MAREYNWKRRRWYRLDNAGLLYSAMQREKYAPVYRFSAVMKERVDPAALQRAVDRVLPRFPSFRVRIRRGLFWYYFEPNRAPGPFVRPDIANPCQPVRARSDNGWLIRFFYYERRISLEVFHAVSDGGGTLVLFKTVLAEYLRQTGVCVPEGDGVLPLDKAPRKEELEDAYSRYAGARILRTGLQPTAYANTSAPEPFYTLNVTLGCMPVDRVKAVAAQYGVTITAYLAAVLIQSILENQAAEHPRRLKPVALAIPINLRGLFPSETLRNFIQTVRIGVDPTLGEYTQQQLAAQVHHELQILMQPQRIRAIITGNVQFARNRLLQIVPLPLKNPIMAFSYWLAGVRPYSATFTNPGVFRVPPEMAPHLERMEVILGQATRPSPHCAAISYGNTLAVAIAGTGVSSETERRFFTHLIEAGIPVKVESNRTC